MIDYIEVSNHLVVTVHIPLPILNRLFQKQDEIASGRRVRRG